MTKRLTQSHARNILPGSVRFVCRDGEYRLAFTTTAIKIMEPELRYGQTRDIYDRIESTAYYTCDLTDVLHTADRMHDDYLTALNSQEA